MSGEGFRVSVNKEDDEDAHCLDVSRSPEAAQSSLS